MEQFAFILLPVLFLVAYLGKSARPLHLSCLRSAVGPTYAFVFGNIVSLTDLGCSEVVFLVWSCRVVSSCLVHMFSMVVRDLRGWG